MRFGKEANRTQSHEEECDCIQVVVKKEIGKDKEKD